MGEILLIIIGILIIGTVLFTLQHFQRKYMLNSVELKQIDQMEGKEFEEYLTVLFSELGYAAKKTKHSGDFGVDILLKKDHRIIAIQAKRYRQKVNLQAVQQVVAGANYYKANEAWVVTNSLFTDSARALAIPNQVHLIGRYELIELMKQAKKSNKTNPIPN